MEQHYDFTYVIIGLTIAGLILWWCMDGASTQSTYRLDERNPARRWCCACGQCQLLECWAEDADKFDCNGWWVANGNIIDDSCPCHSDENQ